MAVPPIVLRPFEVGDCGFFAALASDERVTRFIGDGRPWVQQRIQDRIREAILQDTLDRVGAARWFLAADGRESVGIVVCTYRDADIEIGYWVSPDHWGRGIAGAMIDGALKALREMCHSGNILANVDPANPASAKALLRRSFQLTSRTAGLDCDVLT